jgi:hypothetical protein
MTPRVIAGNHLRNGGKYQPVPLVLCLWGPGNHYVFFSLSHLLTHHLHKGYPEGFCTVASALVGDEGK